MGPADTYAQGTRTAELRYSWEAGTSSAANIIDQVGIGNIKPMGSIKAPTFIF